MNNRKLNKIEKQKKEMRKQHGYEGNLLYKDIFLYSSPGSLVVFGDWIEKYKKRKQ